MVCAHPSQRMAALARLLLSSQRTPDDFAHQKVALQHVHRELREADEANLIDEKDMHIFDLEPMTDPLHLVCCNACRKPIKASQYALHAELCSSLTSIEEEIVLELDGGRGPKKPPRKERKKLLALNSNQITLVKGAKFEIPDACEVNASQSLLEKPSSKAKDCTIPHDGPGNDPPTQNPNFIGSAMPRSRKRSKMIKTPAPPPVMEHFEAANGVISQEALLGKVAPTTSTLESQTTFSRLSKHHMSTQGDDHCTRNKAISDVPVPLATKIYYSYGNHGLRTTLGHLYHGTSTMEHTGQIPNDKAFLPNLTQTIATVSNNSSQNHAFDGKQEKVYPLLMNQGIQLYPHLVHKVDQSLTQSQNFSHGNQLDFHQL